MKPLLVIACSCLLAQCATIGVGVTYQGKHGDYTVTRSRTEQGARWDVLVGLDGKRIVPFEK